MAAGMTLAVAQTFFAALQCTELRELVSTFLEYNSRLDDLQCTVATIKAVLLDADSKHQELSNEGRDWVEKLKDAIYDADDLFDELITKAQQNKMYEGKISEKVRRFFSNDNQLLFGFSKSREIKKLRQKLDGFADDHRKFGFSDQYTCVKRREETCSYVYEPTIIGREVDKEKIVEMLLSDFSAVSFVSIVGMGGMGKTALAQLVVNDKRIINTFGKDLYWICVSKEFGLKDILQKLCDSKNDCTLEDLHKEVRNKIEGKRYLLVLDDVWEESHYEWLKLKEFLCLGEVGSRILVTTRSREVARALNNDLIFELKGLSEENSWRLFKKIAFGHGDEHDTHLIEIGKDIMRKCTNVPLSIKVTSSFLHGRDTSRWEAFRNIDLAIMSCHDEKDPIMSTLMYSYYDLTPELKSCFSFCSLFPKDYVMKKEVLIRLWLAQGYLVPTHEGESMEDVGANYFEILLHRCFFQDVERDEYDEIHSCKMHDLMHDLALKVAGKESLMLRTYSRNCLSKMLRHVSATCDAPIHVLSSKNFTSRKLLRTLFKLDRYSTMHVNVATLVINCKSLRVLDLRGCDMNIPEEIGELLHLRYLNVSYNPSLKMLPRSITKLHNLQILNLHECEYLMELPKDIAKLLNLRMLDIHGCSHLKELPEGIVELVNLRLLNIYEFDCLKSCRITYMPAQIYKLRNLHTLTYFVVGGDNSTQVRKGELTDLKGLIYLRDHLHIEVRRFSPSDKPISTKGANILGRSHLKSLEIFCKDASTDQAEYHETLLEGLYPNNDHLRKLVMSGYQGIKFPNWGSGKVSFPAGVVKIELTHCSRLKHLSSLSKLVNLKYLRLVELEELEYIERDAPCDVSETFFPSLEGLFICKATKLKGWWSDIRKIKKKGVGGKSFLVDANGSCVELLPSFTRLHHLHIKWCRILKYLPPCPRLKKLELEGVNGELTFCMKRSTYFHPSTPSSSFDLSSNHSTLFCLDCLDIDDAEEVLNSLFRESFLGSVRINLKSAKEMGEISEGFQSCASGVHHLSMMDFDFRSVSGGGIKYLTNLQSLRIASCHNLKYLDEDGMPWKSIASVSENVFNQSLCKEDDGMPWKYLASLSSLQLCDLPRLVKLPQGLRYLTSLQSLSITRLELDVEGMPWKFFGSLSSLVLIKLPKLVIMPKDFQYLSSIQSLRIEECDNLEELGEFVCSLTSLLSLHIYDCPKLKSLPEAMHQLTSLTQLQIRYSAEDLVKRCQEPDGEDWPKIRHIPNLTISSSSS